MKKGIKKLIAVGLVTASSVGLSACTTDESANDNDLNYLFYNYTTTYVINETFSLSGAKLKITHKDGTKTEITVSDKMIEEMPDMSTPGTKTVTITYGGVQYTLQIEVVNSKVINYDITGYKDSYFMNEEFDISNLKLKLFYNNNKNETINVKSKMIVRKPDMSTPGNKTVTIYYAGKYYDFSISVIPLEVASYSITGYKDIYSTEETFSVDNIKLNLTYENGTSDIITVTKDMIKAMPDMLTPGTKNIVVTYLNKEYSFSITVYNPYYSVSGYKNSYFVNENFQIDGIKLSIIDNGVTKEIELLSSDPKLMILELPDMSTPGNKTVKFKYNNTPYSFTISVITPQIASYNVSGFADSYFTETEFSANNLKLNLKYEDNTSKSIDILDSMIITSPDMSVPGSKIVVIEYEEKEYSFTINVVAPNEISREIFGYKNVYDINSEEELLGDLKLIVYYENGTQKEFNILEEDIKPFISTIDMSSEGNKVLNFEYDGLSYSISFNVEDLAKTEMLKKVENFMKTFNSSTVKSSKFIINIEGTSKYLEDNAEFNEEMINLAMSQFDNSTFTTMHKNIEKDSKDVMGYVFTIDYPSLEDFNKNQNSYDFFTMNYHIFETINGSLVRDYGPYKLESFNSNYEEIVEISAEEFKNAIQATSIIASSSEKEISIYNSELAKPIYNAIINAVVKSSMNIDRTDILSAKDSLSAELDIINTLKNINSNITNIDFHNHFVNKLILTESDSYYINHSIDAILELFEIENDQDCEDELNYILSKNLKKFRNNEFSSVEEIYNLIIDVNEILQNSNGNKSSLEQLNVIVDGIDKQDKHMLSKFIYSLRCFAYVEEKVYGEHENYNYIHSYYDGFVYGYENGMYKYYYYAKLSNSDELVEQYYSGLQSLIEKFENMNEYSNVKDFAYDVIDSLREMDKVVKVMDENDYIGCNMNFYITSGVRNAVEAYIEAYDAEMIADIIEMLGKVMPDDATQYEIESGSMYPEYRIGDIVTVRPASSYEIGDSIVFYPSYEYEEGTFTSDRKVCHQIVEIISDGDNLIYKTKGIANQYEDSWIVKKENILGKVIGVNEYYLELPANLTTALTDCSEIIYKELIKEEVDYIKLIENLCDRLGQESDYYIEKFDAGEITILTDAFDKYMEGWDETTGTEYEAYNAMRNCCIYMDSLLIKNTNRTELMNEINKCALALYNQFASMEETEYEQMITDAIVKLTNTEKDFYKNTQDVVKENKQIVKEYIVEILTDTLCIRGNDEAVAELEHLTNFYLTAYLKDEFVLADLISSAEDFIDNYCDEETRTTIKSFAILGALLVDQETEIDYNEIFGKLELPNEIKEVDFNKLINETLKDKNTYDIYDVQEVKVDYITDENGNITKEILTISINAKYDLLISALDSVITLSLEISF